MPFVRRVIAAVAVAAMCLVAPSLCATGSEAAIAEQMACCKAGHHACRKAESASDCCNRVAAASPTPLATVVDHVVLRAPAVVAVVFLDEQSSTIGDHLAADSFKRPHDPPHLHAFALLIWSPTRWPGFGVFAGGVCMNARFAALLGLASSLTTLVCWTLPIVFVSLGLGSVIAAAAESAPSLAVISRHKGSVFLGVGGLLAFNYWIAVVRPRQLACAPDEVCHVDSPTMRANRVLFWTSVAIFVAAVIVTYGALSWVRVQG